MNSHNILAVVLVLSLSVIVINAEEKYSTKYDNINLDNILNSDRLLRNYVNCMLDKGSCTADGAEMKKHLSDALKTDCMKCSEKQKDGMKKIIKHLYNNQQDWYKQLEAKYDPESTYLKKHEAEFKKV